MEEKLPFPHPQPHWLAVLQLSPFCFRTELFFLQLELLDGVVFVVPAGQLGRGSKELEIGSARQRGDSYNLKNFLFKPNFYTF